MTELTSQETPQASGSGAHPPGGGRRFVVSLLLVAATFLLYLNTLGSAYHLDDFTRIEDNPEIERFWPPHRHFTDPRTSSASPNIAQYRPLLPLTLSVDHSVAEALGVTPRTVFRITNILVHAANTVLVYHLILTLLGASGAGGGSSRKGPTPTSPADVASLVALLFAVHPIAGIPVNYLAARDLALMTFFLLAFLLQYVHMRRRGESVAGWLGALTLVGLALLAKTNAVVAPLLVLAWDWTGGGDDARDVATWQRAGTVALVPALFFVSSFGVLGFSDLETAVSPGDSFWEYPAAQLQLHVFYYLRNVAWPFAMRPMPDVATPGSLVAPGVLIGLVVVFGTLALAYRIRRRWPVAAFAVLGYWVLLAPTSSVIPLWQLTADYRPYPALPFLLLALCLAGARLLPRRWHLPTASAVLVYLTFASVSSNRTWATEASLWSRNVDLGGDANAHFFYGNALRESNRDSAAHHFREALAVEPGHVAARINLGFVRLESGDTLDALALVREAVRRAPERPMTHYWLSVALHEGGRHEEAAREAALASDLDPRNVEWAHHAAELAQAAGRFQESLTFLDRVRRHHPGYRNTRFLRGFALQMTDRPDQAVAVYRRHLAERPDHVQAHFNLGFALLTLERCSEGVAAFDRVLELHPGYHAAHLHLATCHRDLGNPGEAARHARLYAEATGQLNR